MTDQDVRDLLERMAAEEPIPFLDAAPLTRRARYRAARTVVVGAVGVAAAVAVLVAGVAQIRTESRRITLGVQPAPSPIPFTERFDSPLNGLSIGYPSGWQTRAATEPWGHDTIAFDAPDVDVIFHPTLKGDVYLAVVSEPVGGMSGTEWAAAGSWLGSVGICTDAFGYGGGGGETWAGAAYAWFEYCGSHTTGGSVALLATATRGYIIYLHVADDRLLQATYDEDWLKAALETLELRPQNAVDRLNPSESP